MNLYKRDASGWFKGLAIIMIVLSHYAEWWSWFYTEVGTRELIRDGISRFGPYGVAIFFLFSGYGLAKSAGDKRIGIRFILKRVISVYLPYLIIAALTAFLAGELESAEDIVDLLYGQDFWYMTVLFSFYLAFMAIWLVFDNRHVRAVLIIVFTYLYSSYLYRAGEQDFWYISNTAFAIGTLLALYEPIVKKVIDKVGILFVVIFGIGSGVAVRLSLCVELVWEVLINNEVEIRILAVMIFTLFVASFASVWKWYDPVLPILGKYSLYFYLLHSFLFMWAINYFNYERSVNFIIAAVITLVVSVLLGSLIELLLMPLNKILKSS